MKRRILIILITISLLFEGAFIYHLFTPINNKSLEEVNTKDLSSNYKSIAIVLQNEDDSWEEATDRSKWPSKEDYGYMRAECTDSDGAKIDVSTILKFDLMTYHATIDTKNSIYCTLYFAKGKPVLDVLKETGGDVFAGGGNHTTAVDGMYRYKGTSSVVNNNYICFGTTDKEECLNKPETYMYRIMGITSEERTENNGQDVMWQKGQLKIIKATTSSDSQAWNSNSSSGVKWDSTDMKSYLNGTFYNTIKNATPNGTYWDSIITSHSWYNADYTSVPNAEPTTSHTSNSKIGLMYATDYKNSGDQNTNNWLHLKNGWTGNSTSLNEWTMSRYGYSSTYGAYSAWYVFSFGGLGYTVSNAFAVRPVFYLQPQINLTGKGTVDDPFRIRSMNNIS